MFIEKMDEYLNHYKITKTDEKYLCTKGIVYFWCEKYSKYTEKALLTRAYFNIIDVSIDAVEGSVKYFTVTVEWKGIKKKDSEDYHVTLYRGNKIEWDDIKTVLERFGEPQEKFYRLCSDYLKFILIDCWQQYKEKPYIGWSGRCEDSFIKFLGVNEYGDALNARYPCLFNDDIAQLNKKQDWQESDFQEVFDWLLGNYNLLGIFVYTLHALLFYYSGGMKKMESEEAFAICIHGRDMNKVKTIANLLSNLFEYGNDKMHILKRGSYLSCSSADKQKALFYRIESVPLIVSNKSGRLTRSSSIITTLRNQRLKGEIAYFPVFLSQNAINADEVLDFCVDDIPVRSDYGDWKAKINYLLIQLIIYLEDVEENYDKKLHAAKNTLDDRYITEESRLRPYKDYMSDEAYSKRLLFVACNIFGEFLETEMQCSYIANRFLSTTRELFWADATSKQTFVNATKEADIKSFAAFIYATLEKEEQVREFLCVRKNEKKGGECCIYIDNKEYYPHYKNYCQVNHKDCFEPEVILKCLKEKNIMKQRTNRGQNCMQRVLDFQGKREKVDVLVIKEEAFRLYQNGG